MTKTGRIYNPKKVAVKKKTIDGSIEKKKKHRNHPGTKALREIRYYQKETGPLIPYAPFERVVREVMDQTSDETRRIRKSAVESLRIATEDYLNDIMTTAMELGVRAGKKTLMRDNILYAVKIHTGGK